MERNARIANIDEVERRMKQDAYIEAYTKFAAWIFHKIEDDVMDLEAKGIARLYLGIESNEVTLEAVCNGINDMLYDLVDMTHPDNITSIRI